MKKLRLTLTLFLSVYGLFVWAQTPFVPGNLLVLKAGNGTASSSTASVPVAVVEYDKTGQSVQTINVPSTGSDKLVLSTIKTTTIEGALSLSDDGNYVTFAGYDAEVGATSVQNSSGSTTNTAVVLRTVGHFDANGHFFATKGSSFPGGNGSGVRAAVQLDDHRAWITGSANYLRYVDLTRTDADGSSSVWTSTYTIKSNNDINIFNNQVYFSSAGSTPGVYVINDTDNRFPTSTTNTAPVLLTIPGLGADPNGFVFFDTNEDAIPDLLYIADEDVSVGLQKYCYDGANWTAKGTVQVPTGLTEKALRDVAGVYENGTYVIYTNTGSDILSFTDTAAPDANISATGQVLATADANYVFRGISFTPGTKKSSPRPETYAQRINANTNLIGTITSNVTYRKYPGLEETHLKYTNQSGKEMTMFFLTVDLANPNIKIEAGMPNGGTTYGVQTVKNQVTFKNTANAPDFKVLAATNGDYWDINGEYPATGTPLGVVYMNGTKVKDYDRTSHFFFSILKNKTAIIGDYTDYNALTKSDINYALGGRFYLVRKKDEYLPTGTTDTGLNPRTTAGTLSPTKLIYTVIDGREVGHSAGFTLTDIAKLYRALGVTDAINMDGGGSTTLVTKNADDTYSVVNNPSDGSPRSVANTWMILGKTDPVTPVKLKSFTGEKQGNYVKLNWTTASENNNSHFEIYRSGSNEFGLPIATVQGAGNSKSVINYSYTDTNPFIGTNYYQLNQIDFDGKSEKSNIVAVNTGMQPETFTLQKDGNAIQAIAYSDSNASAIIIIVDVTGHLLFTTEVKLQKGQNYIPLNMSVSNGVYVVTLYADGKSNSIKFVK